MPQYIAPGAAAGSAILDAIREKVELRRREQLDRENRQSELHRQGVQDRTLEIRELEAEQELYDKERQRSIEETQHALPGDIPSADQITRAKKYGTFDMLMKQQPPSKATIPEGQPEVQLPSAEGANLDVPQGSDAVASDLAQLPQAPPEQFTIPGAIRLQGSPQARQVLQDRERDVQFSTELATAKSKREAMLIAEKYGRRDSNADERIEQMFPTDDSVPVYRADDTKRVVEVLNPMTGQWGPLTGPVDPKGKWLQENQPRISVYGAGSEGMELTPEALDMWAMSVAMGAPMPPMGMGARGDAKRTAISNRAAQFDKVTGTFRQPQTPNNSVVGAAGPVVPGAAPGSPDGPPNIAGAQADFKADRESLAALQKTTDAVNAFAETAEANKEVFLQAIQQIPDTGNQWLNKPWRGLKRAFGDTSMMPFDALLKSLQAEYGRLLTTVGLNNPLTVAVQREMNVMLNPDATAEQFIKSVNTLTQEAHNRKAAYDAQIATVRGRLVPGGSSTTTPTSVSPTASMSKEQRLEYYRNLASQTPVAGKP